MVSGSAVLLIHVPETWRCRTSNQYRVLRKDTRFMKLKTAKPSESPMRFFTPELYVRFNSTNDDVADQADSDWEAALQAYNHHLAEIRGQLTTPVRTLVELNLHDAEVLAFERRVESTRPAPKTPVWLSHFGYTVAILTVRHQGQLLTLFYFLWDKVRVVKAEPWPLPEGSVYWLYDEVDVQSAVRGAFEHRVLMSDGHVYTIPFVAVLTHRVTDQVPVGKVAKSSQRVESSGSAGRHRRGFE